MRRLALLLLVWGWPAGAYYHFVRYASGTPPFTPVYDRFDLNALPGRAVPYFIAANGPLTLAPGDSETAVCSQIRAAASVWNSVATAEIRLAFGGFRSEGNGSEAPYIQVEFTDELPPGVIAQGGPVSRLDLVDSPDGAFTPIARSVLRLPRDLSARPSWSERFFLTLVHEFGHTLGLQHTWTSGVMSTEITRAATKAKPLGQDDVAALSVLYPTAEFRKQTGVITGRVTMSGQGVALASVVALVSGRPAVSALTAPDGTYRIEGVPPGLYFVYVHPLPPSIAGEPQPVNLELPVTPEGRVLPGPPFQTLFYPGTPGPVTPIVVEAGGTTTGIDFQVAPISRVNLHSVQTYSFYNRNAIKPATLQINSSWRTVVFTGYGANVLSPSLSVSLLNSPDTIVEGSLRDYSAGYLQANVSMTPFSGEGPRHLIFRLNGETYVLPSGVIITQKEPPSIDSVTPQPDGWLLLEGRNLERTTAVWVDGEPAKVEFVEQGRLRILPPPAPSGHRGVLAAWNPDGQSSLYTHGDASPVVSYASAAEPGLEAPSIEIPAGAEMAVLLRGSGANFRLWTPRLATGTSDVAVRKVWATGEGTAIAWLAARPGAAPAVAPLSAVVGLAGLRLPQALTVTAPDGRPSVQISAMQDQYLSPGGAAVFPIRNLPFSATVANSTATIGGLPAAVLNIAGSSVAVQVPAQLKPGAYLVELSLGGVPALPATIEVRPVPPIILYAMKADGTTVSQANPARSGDVILLAVAALGEEADIPLDSVEVFSPGGVKHKVNAVRPNPREPGTHLVEIRLEPVDASNGAAPLLIARGVARSLTPFQLPLAP